MPAVSPALCVGGSEGEGKGRAVEGEGKGKAVEGEGKGKAVEGENVLAEARRCAGPFGRRGIARLLWRCEDVGGL